MVEQFDQPHTHHQLAVVDELTGKPDKVLKVALQGNDTLAYVQEMREQAV